MRLFRFDPLGKRRIIRLVSSLFSDCLGRMRLPFIGSGTDESRS